MRTTPMLTFGLTGGIACGKSTVARLLAEKGAAVIDADQVARDVVRPGEPAYNDIVKAFGEAVLAPDHSIDRTALGRIVFADAAARQKLNAITHPRIAVETARRMQELRQKNTPLAIYEAALLVETGSYKMNDGLIVVTARPEVQLERLMARDKITEEEARQKIASQLPLEEKARLADYVIDNSGSVEEACKAVDTLWEKLQERVRAKARK